MTDPQGVLADRYRIERELGAGGMATVYLAEDLRHGRKVAIKVLRPEIAAAIGPERFLREITTTASLRHPHVLPLYDSGEANGRLFYAMPFVEGESLRDRLNRERQLPVDQAIRIAREVADALQYAHEAGVIHRDIKPENILLERGHAVVADFGIARVAEAAGGSRLTATGLALGTPVYMSPEQAMGETDIDGRSDVYGLGSVLFEMLAGEPPFSGPTPQSITAKRLMQPAPRVTMLRDAVPPALEAALEKALARSPADRFPTAAAFAAALTADPAAAGPTRAGRVLAGIGAVAILALAAVGIWWYGGRASERTAPKAPHLPPRVAVAVFANRTGDRTLEPVGTMMADWVMRGVTRVPQLEVVDIGALYALGRTATGAPTEARALATSSGATLAVSGAFYAIGDSLRFTAQVLDAASGQVLRQVDSITTSRAEPLVAAEELQGRIASALASIVNPQAVNLSTAAARPPRYEAFEEYIRAQEVYWAGRFDESLPYLRRAVELDRGFTSALVFTTVVAAAGRCPLVDSIAGQIAREQRQLTELDRITIAISQARCRRDWTDALRLQKRRMELLPGAGYVRWAAGLSARLANRPAEAVTILETMAPSRDLAWLGTQGRTFYWRERTAALHAMGRYQDERRLADSVAATGESPLAAAYFAARSLAALGRPADAVNALAGTAGLSAEPSLVAGEVGGPLRPGRVATPGWVMYQVASELVAHGHEPAGRDLGKQAIEWFRARGPEARLPVEERYTLGLTLVLTGQYQDARDVFALLVREDPASVDFQGALGFVAAKAGDRKRAEAAVTWLQRHLNPTPPGLSDYYLAAIAAAQGQQQTALDRIERLPGGAHPWNFTQFHIDPVLADLRETERFQRFIRPRG